MPNSETSCGDSNGVEKGIYRKPKEESEENAQTSSQMKNDLLLEGEEYIRKKKRVFYFWAAQV